MQNRKIVLDAADDLIRLIKFATDEHSANASGLGKDQMKLRDEAIRRILVAFEEETATTAQIDNVEGWSPDSAAKSDGIVLSVIESLSEGIALYDPEDRLVFCNSRMVGWNPENAHLMVPGVKFEELLRTNVAAREITSGQVDDVDYIAKRLEQHRNPKGSLVQRRNNGRWLEITEERTADGFTFVTAIDITDRKLAEEALTLSEEQFRNFAEASSDWFWEMDEKLVFTYVSEQFEQITGATAAELIGKTRWDAAKGDCETELWAGHRTDLETGRSFKEFEYEFPAGAFVSVSGVPFFDQKGAFKGYRGASRNITQTKLTNDKLQKAQRLDAVGQLSGGVAHDFNNLLAIVLGNLELLEDLDLPVSANALLERAKTATLRGSDLTGNMLAFARKAPHQPEPLDINLVARDAKSWIGRTLPSSVSIKTSLPAGLWHVKADPSSLESAILNLILNARDAMSGRGKLTIETANICIDDPYIRARNEDLSVGRYVMLAISDTGHGIGKGELQRIFEPFHSTKEAGKGSGLGLSMVLGFMKQSGGTVRVYSEVGLGTTFKLFFPAIDHGPELRALAPTGATAGINDGLRILLAEDEDDVRETLVETLERAGHFITSAATGDAAYAIFEADPTFDLLLTDIVMPGSLQGTDLAKKIREDWPNLPIAFMSGYANEATVHGNGLHPEDIRLMKPIQRSDLLFAIKNSVEPRGYRS